MNLSHQAIEYFRMDHLRQTNGYIDHFHYLPRPYASLAVMLDGEWNFTEYRHNEPDMTGEAHIGDLLFVPMGSTYDGIWHSENHSVHVISLHFELSEISVFGSKRSLVGAINGEDFRKSANDPTFDHVREFERIAEIYGKNGRSVSRVERYELIWRFIRLLGLTIPFLTRRDDSDRDQALDPAIDYLRENFNRPCTVPELAKLCNLSDSHFYLRFKRATGVSPIEYKNRLMVSNAERLLLDEPELPIEQVAERMGFSSSTYFRRMFKRMSTLSPREFRKAERNIL